MMRRLRFSRDSLTASTPMLVVPYPSWLLSAAAASITRQAPSPRAPRAATRGRRGCPASFPSSSFLSLYFPHSPAQRSTGGSRKAPACARAPRPATPPRYLWPLFPEGRQVDLRVTLLLHCMYCVSFMSSAPDHHGDLYCCRLYDIGIIQFLS